MNEPDTVFPDVPGHQFEPAAIQPFCGRDVPLDVGDVIGKMYHRVAGRVVLGSEPPLSHRERLAVGAHGLGKAALPTQVGGQRLEQRHATFGGCLCISQDRQRLSVDAFLLRSECEPAKLVQRVGDIDVIGR